MMIQPVARIWSSARSSPLPARLPSAWSKGMGQISPSAAILDDPRLAFGTDLVVATAGGYLAWGIQKKAKRGGYKTIWSVFWIVAATAGAMKALHDLSRMRA
jgi:hypothetical protein